MNKVAEIALRKLLEAQEEINAVAPAPYEFPSAEGQAAQIVQNSIDLIEIVIKKSKVTLEQN